MIPRLPPWPTAYAHAGGKFEALRSEGRAFHATAMPVGSLVPGIVNEDAPHGFGGGGEKMGAVLPDGLAVAAGKEPGFVDEGGGLQGLARGFAGEFLRGEFAQLVADQGQQPLGGLGIVRWAGCQAGGRFAHAVKKGFPAILLRS